ncbi:MAG: HAMP domain-containing sensor histidine kinase [Flavobacteriales bacterium]
MNLLQRSFLYNLALAVPMVLIGTAIGYWLVRAVVTEEADEQLSFQAEQVAREVLGGQRSFPTGISSFFIQVAPGAAGPTELLKDTVMPDPEDNGDAMPWRIGRFAARFPDGSPCTITVGRLLLETEDLVSGIALSMTALLVLVVLGNVLVGRWLARRLWRPFHDTLGELERFRIDGPPPAPLPATDVREFTAMNRTLDRLMAKMRADFTAQKRFTEQAAHELQTPLAVMQGRLDQLIQSPAMGEREAVLIHGLLRARERMGRTVADMLLLARIGNQRFVPGPIDWTALFEEQRTLLADLIEEKQLRTTIRTEEPCRIQLHPLLADVLVGNLLRNAVQHNIPSGSIEVVVRAKGFTITNTGPALSVEPEQLFGRFVKNDPSSPSTGLGLSLVKEIADGAGLQLTYKYAGGLHTLVVNED